MTEARVISSNLWEQALCGHLVSHVDQERELLGSYERAAETSNSAAFRYLVTLIVEDERRHHALFRDLATTLQTEIDRRPEAFSVPRLGHWGFEPEHVLRLTEEFLAQEQRDAVQLRDLESQLEPVKDTTMWQLLVRLMESDTEKHVQILQFIKDHVVRPWDPSEAEWAGIARPRPLVSSPDQVPRPACTFGPD